MKMRDGEIAVSIPASGLTAIAIDGIRVVPQFQQEALAPGETLSDKSYAESKTPFGALTGMLLSFGSANTSAYVWLAATEKEVRAARLHYRLGDGTWSVAEDSRYPYEFSLPVNPAAASVSYWVEAVPAFGGAELKSEIVELRR
jgi:hypothetical protein